MQPPVGGLQFQVGHGVVELDIGQAFSDGVVNLGVLVLLELGVDQFHLERVHGRGAVVERDSDSPPEMFVLAVGDEEFLAF